MASETTGKIKVLAGTLTFHVGAVGGVVKPLGLKSLGPAAPFLSKT